MLYVKIKASDQSIVGSPQKLPSYFQGLTDFDLSDLSWITDENLLREWSGLGLIPHRSRADDLLLSSSGILESRSLMDELGVFGNVWLRKHVLKKKGDFHSGHSHKFDHVTLICSGAVVCEVTGQEPKTFRAPTFIVIKKDDWHKFIALHDDTVYFCIYALRDADGGVTDVYTGKNAPYGEAPFTRDEALEKLRALSHCGSCNGCTQMVNDVSAS